jgi:predicted ribosome quality control (RQC) complex YloA/Tae2 family protein
MILANIATAKIEGSRAKVIDYYDEHQREMEIEIGEGRSLKEAASAFFARYQKAKRAIEAIEPQRQSVRKSHDFFSNLLLRLEEEPTVEKMEEISIEIDKIAGRKKASAVSKKQTAEKRTARWFFSTDGYEIGVGRNDRENDALTFRAARSTDVWMHAADYPGSHVIIRQKGREEIPHRTIIEAAEIAAFYSQAKRDGKVAVHYTLKKFVSKPPRSKPGLVRLSSFKTILVEPVCRVEKID